MFWQLRLGSYRIGISCNRITYTEGACSLLENGEHILMWDFDNVGLDDILASLIMIQSWHCLPRTYVLESSPGSYIAYCFKRCSFPRAISIVADTPYVDWQFVKLSVLRGYFTLRIGEKHGCEPRLVRVLESIYPETASIPELCKFVRYETKA